MKLFLKIRWIWSAALSRKNFIYYTTQSIFGSYIEYEKLNSCGGADDCSGYVDKDVLVNLIKTEFALPIDIESMIAKIDKNGDGEIDLRELHALLHWQFINVTSNWSRIYYSILENTRCMEYWYRNDS